MALNDGYKELLRRICDIVYSDAEYRETRLDRAGERLDELAERQHGQHSLLKQELLDRVEGTLSNHSVTDLVEIDVNERGRPQLSWEVDEEAVKEVAKLDGKAMFETTRATEELSAAAVARAYRDRDTVEKFMESIKDTANLASFCRWLTGASDALTGRFRQANREMDAICRYGIAQTTCLDVSKTS